MIRNFFVLSPRGDTILAKQYRNDKGREMGAHERSHTEALFRKIKFWDDSAPSNVVADDETNKLGLEHEGTKKTGDAPPVMLMPDGLTYFHVKRNGLIFGASSTRNVSPNTVLEVRGDNVCELRSLSSCVIDPFVKHLYTASGDDCPYLQRLLWNAVGRSTAKEFYSVL